MSLLDSFGSLFSSGSSRGGGGSALGYSGQNTSSIGGGDSVKVGGGIGAQNFNLGSLGIGTSGSFGAAGAQVPTWVWIAAIGVAVLLVIRR